MPDIGSFNILLGGVNIGFHTAKQALQLTCSSVHQPFLNAETPEINITVILGGPKGLQPGVPAFSTNSWAYHSLPNIKVVRFNNPDLPPICNQYTLVLHEEGGNGKLFAGGEMGGTPTASLEIPPLGLDQVIAVQLLSMRRGVMFHACGMKTDASKGLLLCGFSGSGKSTTARLWQESAQATVLSDERIAVRKKEGRFWLNSTAWRGSGLVTKPASEPLDQLFIISHSETNQARLLKPAEAVSRLLAHAFLPYWDRDGMAFTLEFLEDLCRSIPCYELGFTPNQQAVDYVQCLISS
jgi:hypothetical protein